MSDLTDDTNQEIDLIDLIKTIWSKRMFVIKYAILGAVIGLIIGFSIPAEYTTTIKMAPEGATSSSSAGAMGGLAQLAGINLGSMSSVDGINMTIYPDVVSSTPFLVELSQITVKGKKMENSSSLYDYIANENSAPWWRHVMGLPIKAIGWVMSIGKDKEDESQSRLDPYQLTHQQAGILGGISSRINVTIDKKSGVITASAIMQDPVVAAVVADSIRSKLEVYMTLYKTDKAKRDLKHTEQLYNDAQQKYYVAQQNYASYMDATQNSVKESIRATQDRLRNEQQMAFSVYSQLAQQLELSKMKVQEQTPIATVIEPAKVPLQKSNTSKLMFLVAFTLLGGLISAGIIVVKYIFAK